MANRGLFNSNDGWVFVLPNSGNENVDLEKRERCTENDNDREMKTSLVIDDSNSRKRKQECYSGMLHWITKVARNPCDLSIGCLPEEHQWNSYGSCQPWKQVLLVREAMLSKINADPSIQEAILQKKQKMHPSLYNDRKGSERFRSSERLQSAKNSPNKSPHPIGVQSLPSGSHSDEDVVGFGNSSCKKKIPLGPVFQAHVPDFVGERYEIDCKFLGTRIWPLEKKEQNKTLIERDPIGRGSQEACGCQFPDSVKCVQFHVAEKRKKMKLELGSAFYKWKFNNMGEEVALLWSKDDENKFQHIVASNRLSSEKYFWEELFKSFPKKDREELVNYYYNVFLLRRRAYQNRSDGIDDIDSDDEESEFGPVGDRFGQKAANSPGSIFCSPKKSRTNVR